MNDEVRGVSNEKLREEKIKESKVTMNE